MTINGITKKLQFKKWLEHTGKDKEYLSMDTQRSEITQLLNEKTDSFIIDIQLPPEVRESIHQAKYTPKPLNAIDWTGLAGSDDTITFNLSQLPTDDKGDKKEADKADEADEEEDLLLIDLLREMPSSPPVTPSPPSSPSLPLLPDPPTPYPLQSQQHISGIKKIEQIIRQERAAQEARLGAQETEI